MDDVFLEGVNPTCLSYWFPKIQDAGIPVPKTIWFRTKVELDRLLDGETPDGFDDFVFDLQYAGDHDLFWPVFLRTGLGSGKHEWRGTCYVPNRESVGQHVSNLVEWSHTVDFFGLATDVWAMREFLDVGPAFHAFDGMPVGRERRYFVRDGQVIGHHPYWPPDSLSYGVDVEDWESRLEELNTEQLGEHAELTRLTERVGAAVPGEWSVDWMWVPDRGWVCIDMAVAKQSWVWEGHPTAPNL